MSYTFDARMENALEALNCAYLTQMYFFMLPLDFWMASYTIFHTVTSLWM